MAEKTYMYVGCFTEPERAGTGSGGIVVFEKTGDGPWKRIQTVEQRNPSFLAMSEDKNFLYNVQGGGDRLCAYAINERTGKLSFLNSVPSKAGLALEVCNGYLFVAAGDISVYPLKEDGSIENEVARLTPTGEIGPMKGIQHSAQPHHILHDAQKKYFAVPCRGMDYKQWLAEAGSLDTSGGVSLNPSIATIPEVVVVQPEVETGMDMMMPDSTYTETETTYTTEKSGGYLITYKTIIQRIYSSNGELLMTRSEGPTEVSREAAQSTSGHGSADPSKIVSSLSGEVARVSVGISFKDSLANEILALINASRAKDGLAPVTMGGDSQKLAKARAAAMAEYDSADYKNPLYGDLAAMLNTFGMSGIPSENTWRTASSRSANEIHARFMGANGSRDAIMSSLYTEVGIGIAVKNGYLYISEVFFK